MGKYSDFSDRLLRVSVYYYRVFMNEKERKGIEQMVGKEWVFYERL